MMKNRFLAMFGGVTVVLVGAMVFWSAQPASAKPTITVYKTAACGCCTAWIEHLREEGANDVPATRACRTSIDGGRSRRREPHRGL